MSGKRQGDSDDAQELEPKSELESLVEEKVELATKLGLMNVIIPDEDSYKHTDEFKRIQAIDKLLWKLV